MFSILLRFIGIYDSLTYTFGLISGILAIYMFYFNIPILSSLSS